MKTLLLGVMLAVSLTAPAFAAITEVPVSYQDGDTTLKADGLGAYIASVTKTGDTPLIIASIAMMTVAACGIWNNDR